jgi:hypothetical protein
MLEADQGENFGSARLVTTAASLPDTSDQSSRTRLGNAASERIGCPRGFGAAEAPRLSSMTRGN